MKKLMLVTALALITASVLTCAVLVTNARLSFMTL